LAVCEPASDVGVELLRFAAEVDGLAHEGALHADVRIVRAELVGLPAGEAGHAVRVGEAVALIEFRIDPEFRALPQSHAGKQRRVRGFAPLAAGRQAAGTLKRRADRRIALPDESGLAVEIDQVRVGPAL
jgi:hypothetical protein